MEMKTKPVTCYAPKDKGTGLIDIWVLGWKKGDLKHVNRKFYKIVKVRITERK